MSPSPRYTGATRTLTLLHTITPFSFSKTHMLHLKTKDRDHFLLCVWEVINQVASSRPMLDLGQGLGESVQASGPKGLGWGRWKKT